MKDDNRKAADVSITGCLGDVSNNQAEIEVKAVVEGKSVVVCKQ
jgi:hypothetical protein